jgi:8-oxo-dGTP pyrophosphatase MutT (NUDIX family)
VTTELEDPLRETPVSRRVIHEGRLVRLFDDEVRQADGRLTHREVVEHPGAVCIVATDTDGRVLMVRQWRHPVGRALWELPAGTRDHPGETPEETAQRELDEETGYRARRWRALIVAPLAPGYSSEQMHFFAASDLEPGEAQGDVDEQVELGRFNAAGVAALIHEGAVDIKTVAGLALAGWDMTLDA